MDQFRQRASPSALNRNGVVADAAPSAIMGPCELFHIIRPPLMIAAVKHVWHAAGREVADGHPFPSSTHVGEFACAVNDTPRPLGLGGISLPRIHDKVLFAGRIRELATSVFVVLAADLRKCP